MAVFSGHTVVVINQILSMEVFRYKRKTFKKCQTTARLLKQTITRGSGEPVSLT
jgi:hypothetical protein